MDNLGLSSEKNIISPRMSVLLLVLVSLALYAKMVVAGFLSLDELHLQQQLPSFSRNPLLYFLPDASHHYYRPVLAISMMLDYVLWQEASGFHLTNILFHVCNTLLVFFLSWKLIRVQAWRVPLSFLAALLFAVHPIHTEAVDWISARTDLLATFFSLSAFLSYIYFLTR